MSLEPTAESATDDNTTAYSNVAQPASVKSPNAVSESRFVRSVAPTERKSRVCVSSAQTFSRMCQNTTLGETVLMGELRSVKSAATEGSACLRGSANVSGVGRIRDGLSPHSLRAGGDGRASCQGG